LKEDWSFAHLGRSETLWGPHGYHRYPAKFIPQLVRRLIENYTSPGELVGDPFVGSATTGIEALRTGRHFLGSDISSVALLISRAKCIPLDPRDLSLVWQELDCHLNDVAHIGRRHLTSEEREHIASIDIAHATAEERFTYWFPQAYRDSLERVFQHILLDTKEEVQNFFLCGFSNILRRCSIWLSGSTKAQKDVDKVLGDPVDEFRQQIRDMIKRNQLYWNDIEQGGFAPATVGQHCSILSADARRLPLEDATFDLLVTSPPYATCYEYQEIHQLTQLWFERAGILPKQHGDATWIGTKGTSHRASQGCEQESSGSKQADAVLAELAQLAVGTLTQRVNREARALRYYFQDMHTVLREFARVITPGKHMVLIVGNSCRRGVTIPTSQALSEMAQEVGFTLERRIVRQIPVRVLVSTRDKKTGRFSSSAQSDSRVYPEEDVLIFRKLC
jgi:DNA modification methylase